MKEQLTSSMSMPHNSPSLLTSICRFIGVLLDGPPQTKRESVYGASALTCLSPPFSHPGHQTHHDHTIIYTDKNGQAGTNARLLDSPRRPHTRRTSQDNPMRHVQWTGMTASMASSWSTCCDAGVGAGDYRRVCPARRLEATFIDAGGASGAL